MTAVKSKFTFNKSSQDAFNKAVAQYPQGRERSAIMAALDIAQRQNKGHLSADAIEFVAGLLSMPVIRVYEVASFYSMFNLEPIGAHLVEVCTTTPCWLRGSDKIVQKCKSYLKIEMGETTSDGKFTLRETECLGACANAPVVKIDDNYYEDLSTDAIQNILDHMSQGKKIKCGSQIGRNSSEPIKK